MSAGDKLSLTQVMGRRVTPQGLLSHPGKAEVLTGAYTTFSTLPLLPSSSSSPSSRTLVSVMTEFLPQDLGTCTTSEFQAEDLQASPTLYLLLWVLSLGEASPPAAPAPRVFSRGTYHFLKHFYPFSSQLCSLSSWDVSPVRSDIRAASPQCSEERWKLRTACRIKEGLNHS